MIENKTVLNLPDSNRKALDITSVQNNGIMYDMEKAERVSK